MPGLQVRSSLRNGPTMEDHEVSMLEATDSDTTGETGTGQQFRLARSQRASALVEDYVELISDLQREQGEVRITEVARRLGVSHPTAIKAVARLKKAGLVASKPYRSLFLTEEGASLAARVRARHLLVLDVLLALGVPEEAAKIDAEGIEHHVSEETLSAFKAFLNRSEAVGCETADHAQPT